MSLHDVTPVPPPLAAMRLAVPPWVVAAGAMLAIALAALVFLRARRARISPRRADSPASRRKFP